MARNGVGGNGQLPLQRASVGGADVETCRGPRNYKIFICHRYGDNHLYALLRHTLNSAKSFAWTNLSIQTDRPLRLRTEKGLKASLTFKVKNADLMLVFAHSSAPGSSMRSSRPCASACPSSPCSTPTAWRSPGPGSRTEKIAANATREVRLDDAARIVAAVRRYSRAQGMPITERVSISRLVSREPEPGVAEPRDIARRLGAQRDLRSEPQNFLSKLGALFFGRPAATR